MLHAAFATLGIAVLLGAALFVLHLRNGGAADAAPWRLAALHGLLGIGGLACLVLALRHPPPVDQGTAGFGAISVALLAGAALLGGVILALRAAKKRPAGALFGIHATLAISGFVILAAYILV